jgi:hypothetical protein
MDKSSDKVRANPVFRVLIVTGRAVDCFFFCCVFAAAAGAGILAGSVGQMTFDNLQCRSSGYGGGNFLAYCRSQKYGDYEHGALYYGLEPAAISSLRQAQVIFLGSSKTQAAFSSEAVRNYFGGRNIPFFLLGFGYGEWSMFALAVMQKWHVSPKVLVINADPFFSDMLSQPAEDALKGEIAFLWRLALKTLFQRVHHALCAVARNACPGTEPAIFRSAKDGQWNWIGPYIPERSVPIDRSQQKTIAPDELSRVGELGEKFFAAVGIERRCVVVTGVPTSDVDAVGIAEIVAATLKTRSIFPPTEGLTSVEGSHLNLASAERWSGEFVEALAPILQECIPATVARR